MLSLRRSLVFRYTAAFVGLFLAAEAVVFGVLYASTLAIYEHRTNVEIDADAAELVGRSATLTVTELALLIRGRSSAEPGQYDEFLLVGRRFEFVEGNIPQWPPGLPGSSPRVDLLLVSAKGVGKHRVRSESLQNGYHLLVGRNLAEFQKIRLLIGRALVWTFGLTLLLGLAGGYTFSRTISARLERINRGSRAIMQGDISRRMPVSGSGDEFDTLAANLNRMLDWIERLMNGLREVTDNVAHDLRKPISRMRSRIELALMGKPDVEAYSETLSGVLDEIDQILRVFNALLTIAGAESGLTRDRFVTVDLPRVASSTAEIYEPVAEEANLEIRVQATEPVTVLGDPDLIAQAVANLVDNAIKYAPGTGVLSIVVARRGGAATITVADHGPGIPEPFREKVVKRFFRLEQSRTTEGSGLGLSLVQAVAILHAGRVILGDNAPGLLVTLELPIAPSPLPPA